MSIARHLPQQAVERAATVAWATGMNAITPEALATRNELSIAVAREHLDEAVRLELMDRHALLVGYSDLYTATDYGRKLARKYEAIGGYSYCPGLKKCRVSIGGARHLIACASVAAALERRYPDYRVIGELELRKEEREQRYPLISMDVPGQSWKRLHSPDLVVWPPAEPGEPPPLPVAIEVELSLKKKEELTAICRGLAHARNIEATVYYAGDRKIEEKLLDVIEELQAEETIVVNPLSAIIDPLPGFPLEDE
jgi:hypothetical protein